MVKSAPMGNDISAVITKALSVVDVRSDFKTRFSAASFHTATRSAKCAAD